LVATTGYMVTLHHSGAVILTADHQRSVTLPFNEINDFTFA
jgi:hypothetical protein